MLLRLGELAMEQGGDAAGARDAFRRAWEIQDDVAEHPRSGNYSETDNHRVLSGIAIKQGLAELGLGHPFQARERFRRALELRQAWVAAEPRDVSATSYTSEAEVWLAVAFSHLGDGRRAPALRGGPAHLRGARRPIPPGFQLQGGSGVGARRARRGPGAGRPGRRGRGGMEPLAQLCPCRAAHDPDDVTQRAVTAAAGEGLAALAHKRGRAADADRLWRSALEIRSGLAQFEPQSVPRPRRHSPWHRACGPSGRGHDEGSGAAQGPRGPTGRPAPAGALFRGLRGPRRHGGRSPPRSTWRSTHWARQSATDTATPSRFGPTRTSLAPLRGRIQGADGWRQAGEALIGTRPGWMAPLASPDRVVRTDSPRRPAKSGAPRKWGSEFGRARVLPSLFCCRLAGRLALPGEFRAFSSQRGSKARNARL